MSTAARGRAGALAVLVLLAATLWLGPVSFYLDLVAAGADKLAEKTMLLERYRALAGAAPAEARPVAEMLLPQVPEAQAIALLQETVKGAATASKVRVDGLQVLRSEAFAGGLKITVRVRAAGDAAGLARLVFAIEAARPVLYPDNLQILARAALAGATPGMLDIQLDVSAFTPGAAS